MRLHRSVVVVALLLLRCGGGGGQLVPPPPTLEVSPPSITEEDMRVRALKEFNLTLSGS